MKVLQFTIRETHDKSIIFEQVNKSHFYPYLHRHKESQITWIQQGEGTLLAGNNMHDFSPGDVFFLGSDLPHLFKSGPEYFDLTSNKSVSAITVFFNFNGPLNALLEIPEMKSAKSFFQQEQHGFKLPDTAFNEISQLMLSFRHSYGPEQIMHFFQLINSLYSYGTNAEPLSCYGVLQRVPENEALRINNIYNYIMQYYHEPITLDDAANTAHMTPHAFCRYFKKHTGQTFISFLNEVRINEACKKFTGFSFDSISSVAYNCGFNSITNFNRVFRIITGSSPRVYIDNYNKNFNTHSKIAG